MDRRQFLATGSAAAFTAALVPASVWAAGGGDAALNADFARIFDAQVARSPELASSLGLDKGPLAALKGKLSPLIYLLGVAVSFVSPWLAGACYVTVALVWLIPDRRMERAVGAKAERPD